jgi:hypothetical protein
VDLVIPVFASVAVTFAPATTAPLASFTVPSNVPFTICENERPAQNTNAKTAQNNRTDFMAGSPFQQLPRASLVLEEWAARFTAKLGNIICQKSCSQHA